MEKRKVQTLASTTPNTRIVAMTIFKDDLYVATQDGVFIKGEDDIFRQLKIENKNGR